MTVIDVTTLGCKTLATVGSIVGNTLNLSSNPGFQVGNDIIIEVGGEAGGGQRGTMGVGGAWPNLSYINYDAMISDATKVVGTFAYVEDTLTVYRYNGTVWAIPTGGHLYYYEVITPKALRAKIQNINGFTLILDNSAVTPSTDANIYFDNTAIINSICGQNKINYDLPATYTLLFPEGRFAISDRVEMYSIDYCAWVGFGTDKTSLFSPKGTPCVGVRARYCKWPRFEAISLRGNGLFDGYGLTWSGNVDGASIYAKGLAFEYCTGGVAQNCNYYNHIREGFSSSYSNNCWFYNCKVEHSVGVRAYAGWAMNFSDSTGGGFVDCSVESPYLLPGIETFRSSGTHIINAKCVNATIVSNSSGGFFIDRAYIKITKDSQFDSAVWSNSNTVMGVNTNIQPPSPALFMGGIIKNPRIEHLYPINANNDIMRGIVIGTGCPNVAVIADYVSEKGKIDFGVIEMGGWMSPSTLWGAAAINSTGERTFVSGVRIKGAVGGWSPQFKNIDLRGADSVTIDCVADEVYGSNFDCLTNSQWKEQTSNI